MKLAPETLQPAVDHLLNQTADTLDPMDPTWIRLGAWLSYLVYDRNEAVKATLPRVFGQDTHSRFINRHTGGNTHYRADTELFVVRRDHLVIVAARGSEPSSPRDWFYTDFQHPFIPAFGLGTDSPAMIHSGFAAALGVVWEELYDELLQQYEAARQTADKPLILLCGHSLGGALANLIAAALAHRQEEGDLSLDLSGLSVLTYGQPVTGNREYADWYNAVPLGNGVTLGERTFRHVYHLDLVPRVPCDELAARIPVLESGWAHTGQQVYYDQQGRWIKGHRDVSLGDCYLSAYLRLLSPQATEDHLPWLYVWCAEGELQGSIKLTGWRHIAYALEDYVDFSRNALYRMVRDWQGTLRGY